MRNAYVRVQIGHDGLVVQFNGQTNFKVCVFICLRDEQTRVFISGPNFFNPDQYLVFRLGFVRFQYLTVLSCP